MTGFGEWCVGNIPRRGWLFAAVNEQGAASGAQRGDRGELVTHCNHGGTTFLRLTTAFLHATAFLMAAGQAGLSNNTTISGGDLWVYAWVMT